MSAPVVTRAAVVNAKASTWADLANAARGVIGATYGGGSVVDAVKAMQGAIANLAACDPCGNPPDAGGETLRYADAAAAYDALIASVWSAMEKDPKERPVSGMLLTAHVMALFNRERVAQAKIAERDAEIARLRALVETYQTVAAPRAGR